MSDIYTDPDLFELVSILLPIILGPLSGILLAVTLEKGYFLLRDWTNVKYLEGRRKRVIRFLIFLVLYVLSQFVVYYFGVELSKSMNIVPEDGVQFYIEEGWLIDYMKMEPIDPIEYSLSRTLSGVFIYSLVQIPYSLYWYIRRNREKGKRAVIKFFIFMVVGVLIGVVANML